MLRGLLRAERGNIGYLLMLAWPAIIEQLLQTAVNYVDAAMVGSLGAAATAAVAINNPPIWLIGGIFQGVGVGFSVQVAHAIGAQETERARGVIRQAVVSTLILGAGILLLCLPLTRWLPLWMGAAPDVLEGARNYLFIFTLALPFGALQAVLSFLLRCMGDTRTPLLVAIFSNLVNIALNTLLIFAPRTLRLMGRELYIWGAGYGVAGAAAATSASLFVAALLLLRVIYRRPGPYQIFLRESYRPDRAVLRKALELGAPVALDRAILSAGQIVMTSIAAFLGTVSLAAHHVATTAEAICYLPASGVSYAATTVVGQSVGAQDKARAKSFAVLSGATGFLLMVLTGVIIFVFATPLARIFSPDPEVIELAAAMLRIVAVAEPLFGLSIVLSGVMRGAGDTRWPFYISVAGMWGIRMAMAFLLVFGLKTGLSGLWIAMTADLWFRGILSAVRIRRGKWLRVPDAPAAETIAKPL